MAVGKELQRIRSLNGSKGKPMSVAKLADYLGVTHGKLRKWEDNDTDPKKEDAKKIEEYFKVPLRELNTIKNFKFYTKEITNSSPIVVEKGNLNKVMGQIQEDQVRFDATDTIILQEIAEIKVKLRKLLKEPETSISWERTQLLNSVDAETDRLLVELRKKSQ